MRRTCVGAMVVMATMAAACSSKSGVGQANASAAPAVKIDHSAAANKERDKAIGQLQSVGVLGEVSCSAGAATVVAQPTFFDASARDQAGFADLVYQQCFDGSNPAASLNVRDSEDHSVGRYDPTHGLVLQKH